MDEDKEVEAILSMEEVDPVALCRRLGVDPLDEARVVRRLLASIEDVWDISEGRGRLNALN